MTGYNEWIPNVGVGPILFGTSAKQLVHEGVLIHVENNPYYPDDDDFRTADGRYVVEPDEFGNVTGIICEDDTFYKGTNLLGLSAEKADALFGPTPDGVEQMEMPGDTIQDARTYYDWGLILWFLDGRSVSASVWKDPGD